MSSALTRPDLADILGFELSHEQWQAVSAPMAPQVIVAGAGTGKTTVMAARVLWLVASGQVSEAQVLGLTFTNKAAGELAGRLNAYLDHWRGRAAIAAPEGRATVATYHAFAGTLLRDQGLRLGIEPETRLLSETATAQLVADVVCQSEALFSWDVSPSAVVSAAMRLDGNLAEQAISTPQLREHDEATIAEIDGSPRLSAGLAEVRDAARRRRELSRIVDEVRSCRAAISVMDFGDQMRLCAELVTSPSVRRQLQAAFQLVLLDEYQDTSIVQRMILARLFRGASVTAVGDPLQAIYGWRSASVANIASFPEHFRADPGSVRQLTWNRRSRPTILTAANSIAGDLRRQHPEARPLRTSVRGGEVRAALLPDVGAERRWVAEQVSQVIAAGHAEESIAVLTRTNDDLLPLRDELAAHGVPAEIWGTAPLTSSPTAGHVICLLRLLADPCDDGSLWAVLSSGRWQIGPDDLAALARQAKRSGDDGLLSAVSAPSRGISEAARIRLARFWREFQELEQQRDLPLPELTARVVAVSGAELEAELSKLRARGGGREAVRRGHGRPDPGLDGLLTLAGDFRDAAGRTGLAAFLAHLDAGDEYGSPEQVELPKSGGAVALMTVHKSKGLEFDVVVLPHLCRDVFPASRPSPRWTTAAHVVPIDLRDDQHVLPALTGTAPADLKEFQRQCREHDRSGEDRLAYVAVTRAREKVIASGHWWGPTQKRPRGPSDYLLALRECAAPGADPWTADPVELGLVTNPHADDEKLIPWPQPSAATEHIAGVCALVRSRADQLTGPPVSAVGALGHQRHWDGDAGTAVTSGPRLDALEAEELERRLAAWDEEIAVLSSQSSQSSPAAAHVPAVLTVSEALDLTRSPERFLSERRRPMPRRPSSNAGLGIAFHDWVQRRFGQQVLIADEELSAMGGVDVDEEALRHLKEAFERLEYAERAPHGVEVPFSLALDGQVIRGRIDAIFPSAPDLGPDVDWDVVDWKTSAAERPDPLQLAIYRLAWANLVGIPVSRVVGSFVHVQTGSVERPNLPNAAELAATLRTARRARQDPGVLQRGHSDR